MATKSVVMYKSDIKVHSVIYKTAAPKPPVQAVYIMKSAFPDGNFPEQVTLTIEYEG